MKVIITSDHAGFELKEFLKNQRPNIDWIDVGPNTNSRVDYPDYADKAVAEFQKLKAPAVFVCGSGQGMAMRANRHKGVRAALIWDTVTAKLARQHNDANVLCIGGRLLPFGLTLEILDVFLSTPFEGGRHADRVQKIDAHIPKEEA